MCKIPSDLSRFVEEQEELLCNGTPLNSVSLNDTVNIATLFGTVRLLVGGQRGLLVVHCGARFQGDCMMLDCCVSKMNQILPVSTNQLNQKHVF